MGVESERKQKWFESPLSEITQPEFLNYFSMPGNGRVSKLISEDKFKGVYIEYLGDGYQYSILFQSDDIKPTDIISDAPPLAPQPNGEFHKDPKMMGKQVARGTLLFGPQKDFGDPIIKITPDRTPLSKG